MVRTTVLPLLTASFVACAAQSNFSGVWHLVNVQSVVCANAPGYALINISQPTDALNRPHIFTVFRTSTAPVTLDFSATDSAGKDVASVAVTLQQARHLSELELALPVSPRRLSSRRCFSSGGSSYSSPRRRTPSPAPTSYSSPRRRAPGGTSPSPPSAVGAGGSRRRTFGTTGSNPANPTAGNYGYQSSTAAASNFGGKIPTGTPYGYTGANAYSGSSGSGAKIAMAAGAGLLAGYVGSQLLSPSWTGYSREQMLNFQCRGPSSWTGLCSTCVTVHGAQNCNIEMSPRIDATRDDLLSTGFIPSSLTWPVIVNITKISGVDFDPSKVCPNASDPTWSSSGKQLFITLTTLQELASGSQAASASSSMSWWPILAAILVIGGCCCFGLLAFRLCKGSQGGYGGYGSSSESDWSEADHHGPPGYGGYPGAGQQPYGAQMPQQGYNPYWQGGAPQPIQGVVVQGSPVHRPGAGAAAGAAVGAAVGAVGASGGFMNTAAPTGVSWANFCQQHEVVVDPSTGMISGPWGECLAWAVAYEKQNPGWHQDPRFQVEGPAGQVIGEISAKANPAALPQVVEAAERLEEACQQAIQHGQPLPLIHRRV